MDKLKFFDVKKQTSFFATKYRTVNKSGRRFAVAKSPSGIQAWRIIAKPRK